MATPGHRSSPRPLEFGRTGSLESPVNGLGNFRDTLPEQSTPPIAGLKKSCHTHQAPYRRDSSQPINSSGEYQSRINNEDEKNRDLNVRYKNLVGPQIRRLRYQRSWTQDQLAAKLQIAGYDKTRSSVSKIECRISRVRDLDLCYFAGVLGVHIADLFPTDSRVAERPLCQESMVNANS